MEQCGRLWTKHPRNVFGRVIYTILKTGTRYDLGKMLKDIKYLVDTKEQAAV